MDLPNGLPSSFSPIKNRPQPSGFRPNFSRVQRIRLTAPATGPVKKPERPPRHMPSPSTQSPSPEYGPPTPTAPGSCVAPSVTAIKRAAPQLGRTLKCHTRISDDALKDWLRDHLVRQGGIPVPLRIQSAAAQEACTAHFQFPYSKNDGFTGRLGMCMDEVFGKCSEKNSRGETASRTVMHHKGQTRFLRDLMWKQACFSLVALCFANFYSHADS